MKKKLSDYNDVELFALLREEKNTAGAAFAELYARFSPRVYAYCRRILGDKEFARDVFQETFMLFFQSAQRERNQEMTNVPAYLLRIARNTCLNAKRGQSRQFVPFEDYQMPSHDSSREKNELLELVAMSLELLPDDYREVFILREYDGLSYSEIAEVLNLPLSSVKVRIFRAKEKIRQILAPYLADLAD